MQLIRTARYSAVILRAAVFAISASEATYAAASSSGTTIYTAMSPTHCTIQAQVTPAG